MRVNLSSPWLIYAEGVAAGGVLAGVQAAYQAVEKAGAVTDWSPVIATGLLAGVGYVLAALRWMMTPPPPPTPPKPVVTAIPQDIKTPIPPAPTA